MMSEIVVRELSGQSSDVLDYVTKEISLSDKIRDMRVVGRNVHIDIDQVLKKEVTESYLM